MKVSFRWPQCVQGHQLKLIAPASAPGTFRPPVANANLGLKRSEGANVSFKRNLWKNCLDISLRAPREHNGLPRAGREPPGNLTDLDTHLPGPNRRPAHKTD